MHAELETALSELHLSTERWEAILAAAGRMTERENRRRPLRTGLMAAAICAALAVTAVAVSPPLRETLIQFLGSFENLLLSLLPVSVDLVQLVRQFLGPVRVLAEHQLQSGNGVIHAACRVDAGRDGVADIFGGDRLARKADFL